MLPPSATADTGVLLTTRAIRALGDGLVSVVLAVYLSAIGFSPTQVGLVVTATMLGSAALSLLVGLRGHRYRRQSVLRLLSLLMVATGIGFASFTTFWPLVLIALVGTLNPGANDISGFQPTEQAALPDTVDITDRTAIFAWYGLLGILVAAVGAALAGITDWLTGHTALERVDALRWCFVAYACLGVAVYRRYRTLTPSIEHEADDATPTALGPSKRIVFRLAALFSLDSFGGGFTITAILVLWLQRRFGLSLATSGAVFFWAGLLAAGSQLLAPRIAKRIGLIRTMSFTHLPANGFLVLAALMPNATLAVGCLLARAALSQMDVPARNSYVMAMVSPAERLAAASITSVPRSLAAALPPAGAGWLLGISDFGWPLIIGGSIKASYDLLLLRQFRHHHPPEEQRA